MKFKILSMLVILGMLSVMPMIYMGKVDHVALLDGNLGGLFGSSSSEFAKLKAQAPKNLTNAVTDEKVQVYKWRDENGVMQFSNTPPADGAQAQQVELNPNHNLVKAVKVHGKEGSQPPQQLQAPSPYSVKGMKKVMDDARAVEGMLQQRHEDQRKVLDNI